MVMATGFLFIDALVLTLSPAVRLHSWNVSYRWQQWVGFTAWLAGFMLIYRQVNLYLPEHDPYLLPIAALLSGWGILTIWRLDPTFGMRQTLWLAVSLLVIYAGLRIHRLLFFLHRYKYLWLTTGLAIAALTIFLGVYPSGRGPHLWLNFWGFYLQPSEPLKLLFIVYLAAYLADRMPISFNLVQLLLPTALLVSVAVAILLIQRDLGTMSLFIILYFCVIYLASGKRRILLIGTAMILVAGLAGYQLFDVIRLRVNGWINPWTDPIGGSYQIVQSILAIASGGVLGSGLGLGSPGIVPVAHSDFIFASIAEEYGLAGSIGMVILLSILASRGLQIALRAPNKYQRFLAGGLTTFLVLQSILIMGGNLRLLPLTGVTLPFVSYGGSSLVTSFFSLLILLLISNQVEEEPISIPNSAPYIFTGSALMVGLLAIALVSGWWGYQRSDDLQVRTDNPRRSINDRYVMRGAILDRNNQPITVTQGTPGNYARLFLAPPLAPVVGYTNPQFGQSALEASLDPYLRGLQGNPSSTIWIDHLLYNQPPPGLDVRLSIDLHLQAMVDTLLSDHKGALVLINARSGEILAMASHPYFDPNTLVDNWDALKKDPNAPFINRATQGKYPIGRAFGPFLLASVVEQNTPLPAPPPTSFEFGDQQLDCARPPSSPITWGALIKVGCPGASVELAKYLKPEQVANLYHILGFDAAPELFIPGVAADNIPSSDDPIAIALGQSKSSVTPLQMVLAAAAFSTGGTRPAPILPMAVNSPQQGWVILPAGSAATELSNSSALSTTEQLSTITMPTWETLALAESKNNSITWYLSGTSPDWTGTPLAMALVLEENNPELAHQIGTLIMQETLHP
jgi:cell division protein FtsW (lipid II flippase)